MLCLVERSGTDIDDALANLQPWKDKVFKCCLEEPKE